MPKVRNTIDVAGRGRLVCRIFDNGGASLDRYTIAFKAFKGYHASDYGMNYPYLASSEHPFHSQGFAQHGESRMFVTGEHLGKRVSFDSLPDDVQKFILNNI